MSGPNRRDTVQVEGLDPVEVIEDYPETDISSRRAYHVWAALKSSFSAGESQPITYASSNEVESDFGPRSHLYDWNGQAILGSEDGARVSRAGYVALDVAFDFIPGSGEGEVLEDYSLFLPESLNNLMLHLDAEDLAVGDVDTWEDRTDNSCDFVKKGSRPPRNNQTALNGQPGVEFRWKTSRAIYDGESMQSTAVPLRSLFATVANPWTMHFVLKLDSMSADSNSNEYYTLFTAVKTDGTRYAPWVWYGWQGDNSTSDYFDVGHLTGPVLKLWGANQENYPDALNAGPHLLTIKWTGSALMVYIDGQLYSFTLNTYGVGIANFACDLIEFGDDVNYTPPQGETPMATYGAVYIQSEAISASQLAGLATYVADRWQS